MIAPNNSIVAAIYISSLVLKDPYSNPLQVCSWPVMQLLKW